MDLSAPRPARQPLGYAWLRLTDRLPLNHFRVPLLEKQFRRGQNYTTITFRLVSASPFYLLLKYRPTQGN